MKPVLIIFATLFWTTALVAQLSDTWLFQFPSTTSRQAPRITKGADGTLAVTYIERDGSDANVFVVVSSDHGRTWSIPTTPTRVKYGSVGLQRQPHTVIGGDGTLHCVWENFWNGNQLSIFHSRSTDMGQTWSHPAAIHDVRDGRMQEFSTVAAGRDGLVYIAFISADINDLDGYQHLLMVRSTDAGTTWQQPTRVDVFTEEGGACECCQPHAMVAPDGLVGVAFRSNLQHRRDVFLATSTDDGQTFEAPYLIQNGVWTIPGCPSTGPKIRFDRNGVMHAVWRDTRDAVQRSLTYYARYVPGTRVIPNNLDLTTPIANSSEYADVAVSQDGDSVCVVIETSRGLQILRSRDGGASFQSEIVDPFALQSVSAHVVWTDEGQPLAVWQSARDGVYDLRVLRDPVTSVHAEMPDGTGLVALPTSDGWLITGELPGLTPGRFSIYDVRGRVVGVAELQCGTPQRLIADRSELRGPCWVNIGDRYVALP